MVNIEHIHFESFLMLCNFLNEFSNKNSFNGLAYQAEFDSLSKSCFLFCSKSFDMNINELSNIVNNSKEELNDILLTVSAALYLLNDEHGDDELSLFYTPNILIYSKISNFELLDTAVKIFSQAYLLKNRLGKIGVTNNKLEVFKDKLTRHQNLINELSGKFLANKSETSALLKKTKELLTKPDFKNYYDKILLF